jgi:CTP synthase (UTP-ammonia lyase)
MPRIAIVGEFNPEFHSHLATNSALANCAKRIGLDVHSEWIPTPTITELGAERALAGFQAVFASPGSPYRSMEGMLQGIKYARERGIPFVGT